MLHPGKIVLNIRHEQRQPEHEKRSCQKHHRKIEVAPGVYPILQKPASKLGQLHLSLADKFTLACQQWYFTHAKDRHQHAHQHEDDRHYIIDASVGSDHARIIGVLIYTTEQPRCKA